MVVFALQDPRQNWNDRQRGICVFDDLIEYTGPHCTKYKEYFLVPMATYVSDKQAEVRQAACYGFGVLGLCGGEEFARKTRAVCVCVANDDELEFNDRIFVRVETCASIIPNLLKVISDPCAREEDNLVATENAIAAIEKILKYNSSLINVDEVLPHWYVR